MYAPMTCFVCILGRLSDILTRMSLSYVTMYYDMYNIASVNCQTHAHHFKLQVAAVTVTNCKV